jgi:mycothiol synthase
MPLPEGYSVRPATRDDAAAITEMFIEQETLMNGDPESTVEDLYDDWSIPGFDMERDTWVVFSGDLLAGYVVIARRLPPDISVAYGGVLPSHHGNGLGTFLIESVERRAVEIAGGSASVRQWIDAKDESAIAIVKGRNYSFVRRFWRMDAPLDGRSADASDLEGITIRAFAKGQDERTAHAVLEKAFTEHWGYKPKTYEESIARWEAEWFRPDLSLVAEADGEMVAVCINGPRFDDGYVEDIGVLPEWRGRGVAEALLRCSFSIFREAGFTRASLNVDSDNSTGAMRLYERVGMKPGTCYDVYEGRVGGLAEEAVEDPDDAGPKHDDEQ